MTETRPRLWKCERCKNVPFWWYAGFHVHWGTNNIPLHVNIAACADNPPLLHPPFGVDDRAKRCLGVVTILCPPQIHRGPVGIEMLLLGHGKSRVQAKYKVLLAQPPRQDKPVPYIMIIPKIPDLDKNTRVRTCSASPAGWYSTLILCEDMTLNSIPHLLHFSSQ